MPIPITVPRLGWNMEEGVFVGWLKADGATVRAGEPLFTLESDKSTEDVAALDDGILHIPAHAPRNGETVPVGAAIGAILQPGETVPVEVTAPGSEAGTDHTETESSATPATRTTSARAVLSSPRARRAAATRGIDLAKMQGSGRGGRIRERDVLAVVAPAGPAPGIRRAIAALMLASHQSTAPVTLTTTADATNLVNLRNQFKAARALGDTAVPSYTDFLVKLAATALQKHPPVNARWESEGAVRADGIHVGIAVDSDLGLLVPVVRDVPTLPLRELASRTRDLIDRARCQKLSMSEMQGGTFTVSSLGSFGIDAFTPIINVPECAILGVGRIVKRPAVVGEQIVPREQVTLSLTFDHRVVDGAPAARFLQTLVNLIENPGPWLMT
jgi:pyruvate dehydrogenase E2 component (dihydrolipoamide acetyltransferase)